MQKYNNQQNNKYKNTNLSTIRPEDSILTTKLYEEKKLTTQHQNIYTSPKLIQKQKLQVFIEPETDKKLITHTAAYALKLTNVRAIMINQDKPKYYEISQSKIDELEKTGLYETEYIQLPPKVKQNIKMYYEDNYFYIENGAAYALGYIDVEKFNLNDNLYGPLNDKEINYINQNFNIEFFNIKSEETKRKR